MKLNTKTAIAAGQTVTYPGRVATGQVLKLDGQVVTAAYAYPPVEVAIGVFLTEVITSPPVTVLTFS